VSETLATAKMTAMMIGLFLSRLTVGLTLAVRVEKGFLITRGGYEYALVFGIAGLTFALTGPGWLAVEALLGYSRSGT
jgi:hypothetical protein